MERLNLRMQRRYHARMWKKSVRRKSHRLLYLIRSTRSPVSTMIEKIYDLGAYTYGHVNLRKSTHQSLAYVKRTGLVRARNGSLWLTLLTLRQANKLRQIGYLVLE